MTTRLYTLLLALILSATFALAQDTPSLPHYPTAEEKAATKAYLDSLLSSVTPLNPNPPPPPVRTMAEWEEVQAILISWDPSHQVILSEITRHSAPEATVLIFSENVNQTTSYLVNNLVSLDNVVILPENFNTVWIRDYGPWTVYHNDVDSLMIVDWIYNRPRPQDDQIPSVAAEYFDLPIYEAVQPPNDWVHTGGNNLRDGMGTIFSSELVLEENPGKTEAEIDEIANLFLGADRYVKFETLEYDAISHLDMHMRFIDEETVIIGEYPTGVSDGPQIEENINYLLDNYATAFGNDYNVIRMPMPPQGGNYPPFAHYRTYTNSIFVNKTLLVPTYEYQYDTTALRIYEEALPGYNVVGINCNSIIPLFGALHCITKLVGVHEPLWIAHPRLRDTEDQINDYPVMAVVKHRSGIASATLHYRLEGDLTYTAIPMELSAEESDTWLAAIPAQLGGSVVEYYIQAEANNGKEQVRPLVAPEGYFRFRVTGDPLMNIQAAPQPLSGLSFDLFPNPAATYFDVRLEAEAATEVQLLLSNALGQQVELMTQALPVGESQIRIPTERLSRGTYELTVVQGQQQASKKVIVVK